jgi:hypothetical protein
MTDQPQNAPEQHSTLEVLKGFALGAALVIVCTCSVGAAGVGLARYIRSFATIGLWFVFGFGVSQLIYMLPAIAIARRRRRPGLAKGLIIAASVAFLLNASCFVLFWSGKMGRIAG